MSLNRTLERFFDEVRKEARRNPTFAARLDGVLRVHTSRLEASESAGEADEPMAQAPTPASAAAPGDFNPVGVLMRDGEEALVAALADRDQETLLELLSEHNLDPTGEAAQFDRAQLVEHILAQAQKRVERDKKLMSY